MLLITIAIISLLAINFLLLKFSSSYSTTIKKDLSPSKTEAIREEIQLNVKRRLEERPISYLKVV